MFKNFIIAILIMIIIAGLAYYLLYIKEANPPIESPAPIIIETPIPTDTPFQIPLYLIPTPTPTPIIPSWYYVEPTVDPYWIPGDWGTYHFG